MAYKDPTTGASTSKDIQNQNNLNLRIPSIEEYSSSVNNTPGNVPKPKIIPFTDNFNELPQNEQYAILQETDNAFKENKFLQEYAAITTWNNNLLLNAYNKNVNNPVGFVQSTAGRLFTNDDPFLKNDALNYADNFKELYDKNPEFKSLTDFYYKEGDVDGMMRIWNSFNSTFQSRSSKIFNGLKIAGTDAVVTTAGFAPFIGAMFSGIGRTIGELGEVVGIDTDYNFRDSTREERRYDGILGDFQRDLDRIQAGSYHWNRIFLSDEEQNDPWKLSAGNISQNVIAQYGATLGFMALGYGLGTLSKIGSVATSGLSGTSALGKASFITGKILQKGIPVLIGSYEGHMEGSMASKEFIDNGKRSTEETYYNQLSEVFYNKIKEKGINITAESLNAMSQDAGNPENWYKYGITPEDYVDDLARIEQFRKDSLVKLDKQSMLVYGSIFALNSLVNGIANQFTIKPLFNQASGKISRKMMKFSPDTFKVMAKGNQFWKKPIVAAGLSVASEGIEEWMQGGISAFGSSLGELNMDKFTASRLDPDNKDVIRSGWSVLGNSMVAGFSNMWSAEGVANLAMGVITTGTLVLPGAKKNSNYVKGSKKLGSKFKYSFSPIYAPAAAYKQAKAENEMAAQNIKSWNTWIEKPENNEKMRLISMAMAHQKGMNSESIQDGELNIFDAKNNKVGQMFSAYSLAKKMGLQKEFKGFLDKSVATLDAAIKNEDESTILDYLNQAVGSGLLQEKDVIDPAKRKEAIKTVRNNAAKFSEMTSQMDKIADFVDKNYGDTELSSEVKGGLMYAYLQRDNWKKRYSDVNTLLNSSSVVSVIKDIDKESPTTTKNPGTGILLKYGSTLKAAVDTQQKLKTELAQESVALKEAIAKNQSVIRDGNSTQAEKYGAVENIRLYKKLSKNNERKTSKLNKEFRTLKNNGSQFVDNTEGIITDKTDLGISMSELFLEMSESDRIDILTNSAKGVYGKEFTDKINKVLETVNINFTSENKMSYEEALRDSYQLKESIDGIESTLSTYIRTPKELQSDVMLQEQKTFNIDIKRSTNEILDNFNKTTDKNELLAKVEVLREDVEAIKAKDPSELNADDYAKIRALEIVDSTSKNKKTEKIHEAISKVTGEQDMFDIIDNQPDLSDYEKTFLATVYSFLMENNVDLKNLKYNDIYKILISKKLLSEEYKKEHPDHTVLNYIFQKTEEEVANQNNVIKEAREESEMTSPEYAVDITIPEEYVYTGDDSALAASDKVFLMSGTKSIIKSKLTSLTKKLVPLIQEQLSSNALLADKPTTNPETVVTEEVLSPEEVIQENVIVEENTKPTEIQSKENKEVQQSPVIEEEIIEEDPINDAIEDPMSVPSTGEVYNEEASIDLDNGVTDYLFNYHSEKLKNIKDIDEVVWNSAMFPEDNTTDNITKNYFDFHRVKDYLLSGRLEYYNKDNKENSSKVFFLVDKALTEQVKKDLKDKGITYVPKTHFPVIAVVEDPNGRIQMDGKNYQVLTIYTGNPTKGNVNLEALIYGGEQTVNNLKGENNFQLINDAEGTPLQTYAIPAGGEIGSTSINQIHVNDTYDTSKPYNLDKKLSESLDAKIPMRRIPLLELNYFLGEGEFAIFDDNGYLKNPDEWELQSKGDPNNEKSKMLVLVKKNSSNPSSNTILLYGHYIDTFENWGVNIAAMMDKYYSLEDNINSLLQQRAIILEKIKEVVSRRKALAPIDEALAQLNKEIFAFNEVVLDTPQGQRLATTIETIIKKQLKRKAIGLTIDTETNNKEASKYSKDFIFGTQVIQDIDKDGDIILYADKNDKSEDSVIFNSKNWPEKMTEMEISLEVNRILGTLLSINKTGFRIRHDDLIPAFDDTDAVTKQKQDKLAELVSGRFIYTTRQNIRRISISAVKAKARLDTNTNTNNVTGDKVKSRWTWEYAVAVRAIGPTSDNLNPEQIIDDNIETLPTSDIIPTNQEVPSTPVVSPVVSNNITTEELIEDETAEVYELEDIIEDMSNTGAEPDGTPMAASSVEENDFVTMDLKEELEFLKGIAPYYFNEDGTPMEEAFDTVEGLIDMVDTLGRNTGEKAYGKYKKGKVLLAKKAPKGSSLHEALHGVLDLFFDATERNAFLERARKEFGIGKDIPIGIVEENLVEAFRYAKTGQITKNTNFEHLLKNSFVNRTIYKAKALLGLSPAGAKELFYRVNNNYYTTSREQLKKHIETSRTIEKQDTVPMIEGTIPLDQNQAISIKSLINLGEITYTDDNGNPCAKAGLTNTIRGTNWQVVKDFQGQPKHSQGGVDITITDKGVNMRRGSTDIKAAHGLLIVNNN